MRANNIIGWPSKTATGDFSKTHIPIQVNQQTPTWHMFQFRKQYVHMQSRFGEVVLFIKGELQLACFERLEVREK